MASPRPGRLLQLREQVGQPLLFVTRRHGPPSPGAEGWGRRACEFSLTNERGFAMPRLEFTEGKSSKFWEIQLDGSQFTVIWGRLGTKGQSQLKSFADPAKAQAAHDKLVAEKLAKGYQEVGSVVTAVAATTAPAAVAPVKAPAKAAPATPSDQLQWSPAARKKLHPWRGMVDPPPAPKGDLKKVCQRLQTVADLLGRPLSPKDAGLVDLAAAAAERWKDLAGPPHPNPEVEGALAALLAINDYTWPRAEEIGRDLVSLWLGHRDATYATQALAHSFGLSSAQGQKTVTLCFNRHSHFLNLAPWKVLRARLATAPDYESARVAAERYWHDAPLTLAGALAYAFEAHQEWVRSALERAWLAANPRFPYSVWCLVASVFEVAQLQRLADEMVIGEGPLHHAAEFVPTALDRIGPAAGPALLKILSSATKADHKRLLAAALAAVPSPEAASFFSQQLKDKVLGPIASEYLTQTHARSTLEQAGGERALALRARLDDSGPIGPVAAGDELPAPLADPPWLRPTSQAKALVVETAPLPYTEKIAWHSGEPARIVQAYARRKLSQEAEQYFLANLGRSGSFPERLFELSDQARAVELLNTLPPKTWNPYSMRDESDNFPLRALAYYGLEALPGLLANVSVAPDLFYPALARVDSPRVAWLFADALVRLKKWKKLAGQWLKAFPEAAIVGLLPVAVGKPGKARQTAETALRWLGHDQRLLALAEPAGALEACRQLLAANPLLGARVPSLPGWCSNLPPVMLTSGKQLPESAVEHLATMLALSSLDDLCPGLDQVVAACTRESLETFAWELFLRWEQAGGNPKESWPYQALAHLGGDLVARELTPRLRRWPGDGLSARAAEGLEILGAIGTDLALMHLNGIAQKLRYKALQDKAREKIVEIAEARGLSPVELADRLVPDLDLDPDGSRTLDFGPRQFRVGFDHELRPQVRSSDGQLLKDLPRPGPADTLAGEAVASWKALKKDAKSLATGQIVRLEQVMAKRRRFSPAVFRQLLVEHPLVFHLTRRLVWAGYDAAGRLQVTFRVAEDRTLADSQDEAFDLPLELMVGVAHPLEFEVEPWKTLFTDYQLLQPFAQLDRQVYRPDQPGAREKRFEVEAPSSRVLGLEDRGWRRDNLESGVMAELAWGPHRLTFDPGVYLAEPSANPRQSDFRLRLGDGLTLGRLDPVEYSEMVLSIERLGG